MIAITIFFKIKSTRPTKLSVVKLYNHLYYFKLNEKKSRKHSIVLLFKKTSYFELLLLLDDARLIF